MENKEIIIDGADVNGCDFYDKNKKYCLTLKMDTTGFKNPSCFSGDFQKCIQDSKVCPNTFCDNNPNCYYKQLKRKKQECEAYKMEAEEGKEINAELKAENENLTTINARLLGRLEVDEKDASLVFNLDKELRQKEKEFYTAIQKVVKLKQTLTEIKEIAEENFYFLDCDYRFILEKILQKIRECEGNNEN